MPPAMPMRFRQSLPTLSLCLGISFCWYSYQRVLPKLSSQDKKISDDCATRDRGYYFAYISSLSNRTSSQSTHLKVSPRVMITLKTNYLGNSYPANFR